MNRVEAVVRARLAMAAPQMGRLAVILAVCAGCLALGEAAAHPGQAPGEQGEHWQRGAPRQLLDLKLFPLLLKKEAPKMVTATKMVPRETTEYVRVRRGAARAAHCMCVPAAPGRRRADSASLGAPVVVRFHAVGSRRVIGLGDCFVRPPAGERVRLPSPALCARGRLRPCVRCTLLTANACCPGACRRPHTATRW